MRSAFAVQPLAELLDHQPGQGAQFVGIETARRQARQHAADDLAGDPGIRHDVGHHPHRVGGIEPQCLFAMAGDFGHDAFLARTASRMRRNCRSAVWALSGIIATSGAASTADQSSSNRMFLLVVEWPDGTAFHAEHLRQVHFPVWVNRSRRGNLADAGHAVAALVADPDFL